MLYTVVPLEQIYRGSRDTSSYNNGFKSQEIMESQMQQSVNLDHGYVDLCYMDGHYVVDRVHSTNMSDYLDERYQPGKVYEW